MRVSFRKRNFTSLSVVKSRLSQMHMYALFVAYVKRRDISTFKIYLIATRVWQRYNFAAWTPSA